MERTLALAIDPGTAKWGLALVDSAGACVRREHVAAEEAPACVAAMLGEAPHRAMPGDAPIAAILLGDRTGARAARERIAALPLAADLPLILVPEHGTTLLARELYWRDHPPSGWRRLLPRGLLLPPEPLDSYAAEAIALRHFGLLEDRLRRPGR